MKNIIRIFCSLFILNGFAISGVHAQDLTGIWRGHFHSNDELERVSGNYDDRYKIEVQIAQTQNHFIAITYSYKNTEFYGKADATGNVNVHTKKVMLKEGKLLEVRTTGGVCVMTCFFQYSKLGNDEYLQGTYFSTSINDSSVACGRGSIFLHRVTESDFHKEPILIEKEKELTHKKQLHTEEKTDAAVAAPVIAKKSPPKRVPVKKPPVRIAVSPPVVVEKPAETGNAPAQEMIDPDAKISHSDIQVSVPTVLKTRTNELLKTITVNHNTVELRIYDDGAIDNDTVSVYYDNKLLISNARLSDLPITVSIPVEPSDHPHQLVMVAENLGDIPPNTSLLVIQDGEKRYEERIISNEQKNIVINFQYKKIE